jgi:hypothetical protein
MKITTFFHYCSGAHSALLEKCPSESSKYVGIGATVFFTGLFAALSGAYALYTVFDSVWIAGVFGLLWGLMIFNLDRYIVSSMRKEGKRSKEILLATPRLVLAVLISVVIAKPLELKIFEKEIEPELIVMEQETFAAQEAAVQSRFQPTQDSIRSQLANIQQQIDSKTAQRDFLVREAQQEADGTGGSRRRNLGPIYKVKKADADAATQELADFKLKQSRRIQELNNSLTQQDSLLATSMTSLERSKRNGLAARMEALSRLTEKSNAILLAHLFIFLLFVAIETSPVIVKLIAPIGPYDNMLRKEEHTFVCDELESRTKLHSEIKERITSYPVHERDFLINRLDAELPKI